jgi:O-antigen/teichoic acid export membrane protein
LPEAPQSKAARATTGRSVLSGGLWYVASYGIPQAYTLIVSIAAARFLGPEGMGRQSFIAFISITTTSVLAGSMYVAVMRFIGETRGQGRDELLPGLLWWAWRIEGIAALIGGGTLALAAAFGAGPQGAWVFAAVVTFAGTLHAIPTAVLIGLQQFRRAAIVGLVTGFVGTAAVTIVLWQGGGITGMFATEAVVGVLNLLWTGTLARRSLAAVERGVEREPDRAALHGLRRSVGRYALLWSIGLLFELIVATRSEFFFLAHFSGNAEIAFYSIAYSAVAALRLIPKSLAGSTAPAFATLYGAQEFGRIRSGYSRSLRLLLLVTLPLTAVALALGPELIEEVYGRDYAGAGGPVRILLLAFPVIALSTLASSLLAGYGKIRLPIIANVVAAVVDVGLAAGLIPVLDARGAAIANAAGQGTFALLMLLFAARLVRPVDWRPGMVVRASLASAGVGLAGWGAVTWLDGFPGLAVGFAASILAFAALATILRIVPSDDARWAEESAGRRVGRLVRFFSLAPEGGA